jgi:hypothetical protein
MKITPDIKEKMVEMRTRGATYIEIQTALGVSKERCIAYLKDIPQTNQESAMEEDWKIAETEARQMLEKFGFKNIHNLNSICAFPPYWDYLAEKDGWWLIDVTINGQKSIAAKRESLVDNYTHAILLKTNETWKLIKLQMQVIMETK